jgi:5'-nucleotidase
LKILLSNDDGVHAPGIRILFHVLREIAEVTLVAPLNEQSAASHALTLHNPLRLRQLEPNIYGVNGTPADSVRIGLFKLFADRMPDLVVSGINNGQNLGEDIYYSGTFAAAREGYFHGISALAISLHWARQLHYETAAHCARKFIEFLVASGPAQPFLFNMNVPSLPLPALKGLKITRQGKQKMAASVEERTDPRGGKYYWIGVQNNEYYPDPESDNSAILQQYASISPIQTDTTDHPFFRQAEDWNIAIHE